MALSTFSLKNKYISEMKSDFLYHLNINVGNTKDTTDIQKQFGDVRVVCMGGTKSRMLELAKHINEYVYGGAAVKEYVDLSEAGKRYAMYKVGQVICASHGVGSSTMSVLLHELIKLVYYAKCHDPIFIRVGTCGGLGVVPGTVVVTKDAFNGYLCNHHEIAILGKKVVRDAKFDEGVLQDILKCHEVSDKFEVEEGNTMGTDCFYEGQGRTDGASCEYSDSDKMEFLQKCSEKYNIKNIEMEASMFSSLTKHVGIKAADVCVTLINRLNGDQVNLTKEQKADFEMRPLTIVGRYIKRKLDL